MKSIFSSINRNFVNIGITVVIVLILHNFIISFYGRIALNELNEFESTYLSVNNCIEEQSRMVNLMDLGLRGYYMNRKENFADPYNIAQEKYKENLDSLRQMMSDLNYPHLDSINFIKKNVTNYSNLVGQGLDYIRSGQPEKSVELFQNDPGYDLWRTSNPIIMNITGFMNEMNQESKDSYHSIALYSLASQLITVIIGMPILILVLIKLVRQEKRIIRLFQDLDESNQKYIFKKSKKGVNQKVDQSLIINRIIANLKKATSFIQSITKGNLAADWEGMTEENRDMNQGTLAGELVEMRNQLKTVKESDRQRQWIAEGITNFSDLVRSNKNNFDEMTARVISFIVTYTKSNQGGLYLLNDSDEDDKYIELVSCYAYEKQKFIQKRIEIGSGLLGQVFLEGETALYKDIPKNYISITSGLGDALPRNLILVPVKLDNNVQGVLELASFSKYESFQIEFLEKLSEVLGSEIVTNKSSQLTRMLLDNSKENEEMMRSQEEEMRQNMEELQATQEEQERQRTEMLARIKELEEELEINRNSV